MRGFKPGLLKHILFYSIRNRNGIEAIFRSKVLSENEKNGEHEKRSCCQKLPAVLILYVFF